jgi:hypothetical protein
MSDAPEPSRLDLDRYSEALRRWLYDRVVQIQFSPPDSTLTPDEAALQILCILGRWFAIWTDLDQPPAVPVRLRFQVVRIGVSREDPADIQLYAV